MNTSLKRILSVVLSVTIMLSCTMAYIPAAFAKENASVDVSNAYVADASGDHALLSDVLSQSLESIQTEGQTYAADDIVSFIVTLKGDSLLDTKPESQSVTDYMESSSGLRAVQQIETVQSKVKRQIDASKTALTVKYRYSVVLNGFAVVGPYSALAELASMDGVKSVTVAQTYDYVEPA